MKIVQYSQHVLGMGHFFRSLEIATGLARNPDNKIVLASGGAPVDVRLPENVHVMDMPALVMDNSFLGFFNPQGRDVQAVQQERIAKLFDLFERERPDVLLVELFPFGRKKFRFELLPLLKALKENRFGPVTVLCSLRDILVERDDQAKYERRVLKTLNEFFHGVIIHSDPKLVPLEASFPAVDRIRIPVRYSGYVAARAPQNARERLRTELGLDRTQPLILASAGAGAVGGPLMLAAAQAFALLADELPNARMIMFTGPGLDDNIVNTLRQSSHSRLDVQRFTPRFLEYMEASDLSVSMAGYNTTMNILATRTPALVWPFAANREQAMRARLMEQRGLLSILNQPDLAPTVLASRMLQAFKTKNTMTGPCPDINGASATSSLIEEFFPQNQSLFLSQSAHKVVCMSPSASDVVTAQKYDHVNSLK